MTHRIWSHPVHHAPLQVPRLPGLPRLHLSGRRAASIRKWAIVALCALLAGGLTYHLRGATKGPYAPTTPAAAARA